MEKLRVIVGSKNPVKINAALTAFQAMFPGNEVLVEGADAPSSVPDQPMNFEETRDGAKNRVEYLIHHQAMVAEVKERNNELKNFYIAYEGGVDVFDEGPRTFAVICISDERTMCFGQTATMPIPLSVYQKLLQGEELGGAMDGLFNTVNIKQKGGAIGQLTNGLETRQSVYTSATILALAPYVYSDLFEVS
ncbi:inosine/xanthosine triphosphatase [Agaribacter marinus]|uniref:inosine/xanthosine triphosphatase n=1 Tax=Agaribacter marinus TaxID=1431249 RepID=A0AA37SX53_9ALTE|nr:non-canonical purine NTP phosphatase [Agaribacter marinus]